MGLWERVAYKPRHSFCGAILVSHILPAHSILGVETKVEMKSVAEEGFLREWD